MSRRLVLRLAGLALITLVVLVTVGVLSLSRIVHWVAVRQLESATERAVTIDTVDVSLLRGRVAVRGLRVADTDSGTLASVARIEGRIRLSSLLLGRIRVLDALVEAPAFRIVRVGPREYNISHLLGRERTPGRFSAAVTIDRFVLRGGVIDIEDRTRTPARTWRVDGIEGELREASTLGGDARGAATLRARERDAVLALDVTALHLAPLRFHGTVAATGVDAGLAMLVVPPVGPVSDVAGTVIASGAIDRDASGAMRAALDVVLARIALSSPHQKTPLVSVPALKATAEIRAGPGAVEIAYASATMATIVLEDARHGTPVRWALDGVIAEARGISTARDAAPGTATVQAEMQRARIDVYAANVRLAPAELHATAIVRNADVTLFRLALPSGFPATPERGLAHATVRIDHDQQHGTRLALDGAVQDLLVQRPEHVLSSPEIRASAENISIAGGAVTLGRLSLATDRVTLDERAADPPRRWLGQQIDLEVKDLSSRRDHAGGVGTLRASVAGASITAYLTNARLAPLELHATANFRDVDLGLVRLYLPPRAAVRRAGGVANGTIDLDHTEANGTRITGDAVLSRVTARVRPSEALRLEVSAPSLRLTVAEVRRRGTDLTIGRVELTGAGSVVDRRRAEARVDLTEIRAVSEGLAWPARGPTGVELSARFGDRSELEVKGTAQLTAPPPDLAWTADLGVRLSRVDLAPVGAWVPAASGVGGRLRGTLTATLAYAGSLTVRVRGDVAGGRFALTEGDRTVLALRRIDIAGLDADWPQRIAIKHVKLQQPYALVERDRQGAYPIAARFAGARGESAAPEAESTAAPPRRPEIVVEEVVVEDGSLAVHDDAARAPVRLTVPRVAMTIQDVTWPGARPARVALDAQLPGGGSARAEGTVAAEPSRVDLKVTLAGADLPLIQPYLAFPARLRGRVDATVSVAGPVQPALRVAVRGDAAVQGFALSDGRRRVVTVEQLQIEGIDAAWPERVTITRARARRSWALLERDRQGQFLLRQLLERPPDRTRPGTANSTVGAPAVPAGLAFTLGEAIFEDQGATIVDATATPPARVEISGARLHLEDLTLPSRGPMKIDIASPMPGGGTAQLTGTAELDPVRVDVRAALKDVALEPAQGYVPIEGRIGGLVTGDLALKVSLDPLVVQAEGDAQVRRFSLSDGDRPVVTVARMETGGIAVDWPQRIAVDRVRLRAPRLLVERSAAGDITLVRLISPRWPERPPSSPSGTAPAATVATSPPTIEVANLTLERATGRFVDQTTTPPYAEELSRVDLAFTPLAMGPGARSRFAGSGDVAGGTFKVTGDGVPGQALTVRVELRDIVVPRANPYLERFTAWTATRGSLSGTAEYVLDGTRLTARHDLVLRNLDVAPTDARDEVERRIGLPFGFLVSLLKDARGDIKLSLPVSGDLGTRAFDFQEAVWGAVRSVAIRLLALPFSRIGSLFMSEDSKVESVALTPVLFEPGGAQLASGMTAHLERVARFLQGAPSVKLGLRPILTQADVDALKREQAGDDAPAQAMQALSTRRLDLVRETLTRSGVDAARIPGIARRRSLVEEGGSPRVELDLRPETQVSESREQGATSPAR